MRKYIQLVLVVIAVASISLMLLYERKYSKMKMILEILNGFNYKQPVTKPQLVIETTHEPHFIPNPTWEHLSDSLYLYSAYWQNTTNECTTLLLATSAPVPESSNIQCYLWYDGQLEAVLGKVEIKTYATDSSDFFVSCSQLDKSIVPYGITISYKSRNSSLISVSSSSKRYQMAACLETLSTAFQDTILLAEFLIFHQYVGVDYFVIYEKGLSPVARRLADRARHLGYKIDILHWNYPSGEAGENAQLLDCLARSFLVYDTNNVATLKLRQFLVPKSANNLTEIMKKLKNASSYKPSFLHFCNEFPIDVVAKTLNFPFISLKYTKHLVMKASPVPMIYRKSPPSQWNYKQKTGSIQTVPAEDVMLYVYGNCYLLPHEFSKHYTEDVTMTHYKNVFFTSLLYRYLEKGNHFYH